MKRSILSILTVFIITLSAIAQPRLSSNKETHNFGQIEWKHPVTVEYTITNTGDKPMSLHLVPVRLPIGRKSRLLPARKVLSVQLLMPKPLVILKKRLVFTAMHNPVWYI